MAYLVEILFLVVFVILWLFSRWDLKMVAKQARSAPSDELGRVRENIERLLDVLEQRSTTVERTLRQLIDEAKAAAVQIDEATVAAVNTLEQAATDAHVAARAGAATPNGTPRQASGAQEPPVLAAKTSAQTAPAREEVPSSVVASEPALPPAMPQEQSAPAVLREGPPAAHIPGEKPPGPEREEPAKPVQIEEKPVASDAKLGAIEPVGTEAELAQARIESVEAEAETASPGGLNQVPIDAPIPMPAPPAPPEPAEEEPGLAASAEIAPLPEPGKPAIAESMPPIEDVFTPWPVKNEAPPPAAEEPEIALEPIACGEPEEDLDFRPFTIKPEVVADVNAVDESVPAEASAEAAGASDSNGSPEEQTDPRQTLVLEEWRGFSDDSTEAADPGADRFAEVYALAEQGIADVTEIAKKTGLGQTEVEMVLSLWRRK